MDRNETAISIGGERNFLIVGLIAAIFIVAVALGLSALFAPEIYESRVAFVGLTAVPAQLVIALLWRYQHPAFLARLAQPMRGIAFAILTFVAMGLAGAFLYFAPGRGAGVTPMLIMASIMSVVAAFWIVEVWRAWPLSRLFGNGMMTGIAAWVATYLVGYGAYELLFNFAFAKRAPFYSTALDPAGLFDAWDVLVFAVTTTGTIVIFEKIFGAWPLGGGAFADSPVRRGLAATTIVLVSSLLLEAICVGPAHFELIDFMVRVPIALIFGVFLVTNLTQSRLFATYSQPAKGLLLLGFVVALGVAMEEFYRAAAPVLAHQALRPGAPEYRLELWVATALLSVTFPLIIVSTGYFDLWPFKGPGASNRGG